MTAVILPPEVVAECVGRLNAISADAMRDGATLNRLQLSLLTGGKHGTVLGNLKKYARANKQFGANEVEEIITVMEAAMNPEHLTRLARLQVQRDRDNAAFLERQKQPPPQGPVIYPETAALRNELAKLRGDGNVVIGPWQEGA